MLPPLIWMLCIAAGLALLAASIRRIPEGQVYALRRQMKRDDERDADDAGPA